MAKAKDTGERTRMEDRDTRTRATVWPIALFGLPAFVAIWSGWVDLGRLAGFGTVRPLPGIADGLVLNTAITLPIGLEAYAAFALRVWLSGYYPPVARNFAKASSIMALVVGAMGQVTYHLLVASGATAAQWPITVAVATVPVVVLGMGASLLHLARREDTVATGHAPGPLEDTPEATPVAPGHAEDKAIVATAEDTPLATVTPMRSRATVARATLPGQDRDGMALALAARMARRDALGDLKAKDEMEALGQPYGYAARTVRRMRDTWLTEEAQRTGAR